MPSFLERLGHATRYVLQRNIPPPAAAFSSGYGIPALASSTNSLNAFSDNVYVHRAVMTIALEIARIPLKLQTTDRKGEPVPVKSHQALETIRLPQPISGGKSVMSAMDLKLVTLMHFLLAGEAFWNLDRRLKVSGSPTKVNVLLPSLMHVKLDSQAEIMEYRYRMPDREIMMDPMDVVHFKIPDPTNWLRGHSPIQSIRYAVESHLEADRMGYKKLSNNAVPGGLLKTEKRINDEDRRRYLSQWNQTHGGGDNTGKTAFLPEGIEFQTVQQTNQEMQFIESKGLNRDEILTAYGVGLEIFGKTESQTRANAEAAIFVFQRFGVLPFLEKFVDTLNTDYLPAFAGTEGMSFHFEDPVPQNTEEKRLNAQTMFSLGAMTPNELRKDFGKEALDLDGMDTPYLDMGKVPVGQEPYEPPGPFA